MRSHPSCARRALLPAIILALSILFPLSARGQAAQRSAEAQALFDDAVKLMAANQAGQACPKFAESQRLDPGAATQFRLAECYEKTNRTASAWSLYLEVADVSKTAGNADREKLARARAAKLEPQLARVKINVPDEARAEGLVITIDGGKIGDATWGTALPLDPGTHLIAASAPGKAPWQTSVVLGAGETPSVQIPPLAAGAVPAPSRGASSAPVGTLVVTSDRPGKVSLDGEDKGPTPVTIEGVDRGFHKLRIVYDRGGDDDERVFVDAGGTQKFRFELSASENAFTAQRGLHFGFALSAPTFQFGVPKTYSVGNEQTVVQDYLGDGVELGVRADVLVNYGIVPWFDVRAGASIGVSGGKTLLAPVLFPLTGQFHLGSYYTAAVGIEAGFAIWPDGGGLVSEIGPTWSVAGVRFGAHRELEIAFTQSVFAAKVPKLDSTSPLGLDLGNETSGIFYYQTLKLTYLIL